MSEQRPVVERKIRRADHCDRIRAEVGGMSGELDRVARRLGAAMDGDRELVRPSRQEELCRAAALRGAQQDPLSGGTEGQQPVETAGFEETDERIEGVFVQQLAAAGQRRHGGSENPAQHRVNLRRRLRCRRGGRGGFAAAAVRTGR